MRSDRTLKRRFNHINDNFFLGALPSNICVRYTNDDDEEEEAGCSDKYYGWADHGTGIHKYMIVISEKKNPGSTAVTSTLVHEMVHCATNLEDDHDEEFSRWHELLTARGLFRKGAVLRYTTLF